MGDLIDLTSRFHRRESNLIVAYPLEFRRGEWQSAHAALCRKEESLRYEERREKALLEPGQGHVLQSVPNHVRLDEGYHYTVAALFRHRSDETAMRRIYRLAGLMECVTNVPSPVLRSDLLRRFYQNILEERESLGVVWGGNALHFLLPLDPGLYNPSLFFHYLSTADSLMNLFDAIEVETGRQFDILSKHYVIYLPERFSAAEQ